MSGAALDGVRGRSCADSESQDIDGAEDGCGEYACPKYPALGNFLDRLIAIWTRQDP